MNAPSAPPKPRRPLYLFGALAICFGFASMGALNAFGQLEQLRAPRLIDATDIPHSVAEEDRPKVAEAFAAAQEVRLAHRNALAPVSAAELVLGFAMLAYVARVLAQRPGALSRLRQIVIVQAVVVLIPVVTLPAVQRADASVQAAFATALSKQPIDLAQAQRSARIGVIFRTAMAALVLLALSRPRVVASEPDEESESLGPTG